MSGPVVLELYGSGRSRWVRPLWMLRELGVPHREVAVDREGGQLDSPEFRAISPQGKIPVLLDDGRPVLESSAILMYLGDKFPGAGLVPPAGTYERALHDRWMFFLATEFEAPIWLLHRQVTRQEGGDEVGAVARAGFDRAAIPLESRLHERPFLAMDRITAADFVLGHLLTWQVVRPLLKPYRALRTYRDRAMARPAFPSELYAD